MQNEQQIADNLQKTIARPEPTVATPVAPGEPQDRGYTTDLGDSTDMYKLYDYFEIGPVFRSPENEQKIQLVYRWAANVAQSADYLAVAKVISSIQQGMSAGFSEQSSLDKVYSYVKLQSQIDGLKQQQDMLYG